MDAANNRRNITVGDYGERITQRMLQESGYTIIDRNWRCASGEIDIVSAKANNLVFIEVKTRSNSDFGMPEAAVGSKKRRRLRLLAGEWIDGHPTYRGMNSRIDVVAVHLRSKPIRLVHLQDVA